MARTWVLGMIGGEMPKAKPKPAREKCDKGHEMTYENTLRRRKGTYVTRLCRTCRNEYQRERKAVWAERRSRIEKSQCAYCRKSFELTYQAVRDTTKRGGLFVCPKCKPVHREEQRTLAVKVEDHHRSYWRKHPTLNMRQVVEVANGFWPWWDEMFIRKEG